MEHVIHETLNDIMYKIENEKKRKIVDTYDDGYWEQKCPGRGCNEMIPYYSQACGTYCCLNESFRFETHDSNPQDDS